jgi:hypothetical protein
MTDAFKWQVQSAICWLLESRRILPRCVSSARHGRHRHAIAILCSLVTLDVILYAQHLTATIHNYVLLYMHLFDQFRVPVIFEICGL